MPTTREGHRSLFVQNFLCGDDCDCLVDWEVSSKYLPRLLDWAIFWSPRFCAYSILTLRNVRNSPQLSAFFLIHGIEKTISDLIYVSFSKTPPRTLENSTSYCLDRVLIIGVSILHVPPPQNQSSLFADHAAITISIYSNCERRETKNQKRFAGNFVPKRIWWRNPVSTVQTIKQINTRSPEHLAISKWFLIELRNMYSSPTAGSSIYAHPALSNARHQQLHSFSACWISTLVPKISKNQFAISPFCQKYIAIDTNLRMLYRSELIPGGRELTNRLCPSLYLAVRRTDTAFVSASKLETDTRLNVRVWLILSIALPIFEVSSKHWKPEE